MAGVTVWQARRVGDRVLCGRQEPPGGPYKCMGEIATVISDMAGYEQVRLRPGLTPEPGSGEPRYRATSRIRFPGRRLDAVDEASGAVNEVGRGGRLKHSASALPLSAPCSHKGHLNRVTSASLRVL